MMINISSSKENETAEQILSRVLSEWDSGKEKIHYVFKENRTKEQYRFDVLESIVIGVIGFILILVLDGGMRYFIANLIIAIGGTILFHLINSRKAHFYYIHINRKTKKIQYSFLKYYRSGKYHDLIELPAFRLPETNSIIKMNQYIQMRNELQQKISAETGWLFNEHWTFK